mgnify:CR=1 FL=1
MNLIKKELIEEAALKNTKLHYIYAFSDELHQDAKLDFEKGVEFAESQLEELAIDFAEWIKENNEESYDNLPTWEAWLTYKVSTNTLFQQFIKERNEK